MILDDNVIQQNKEEFISLLKQITREGARIEDLVRKLENSDFFIAPASTRYHGSYKGGLCDHCLNVYHNLSTLVERKHSAEISTDSILIVALLHDFSKMNYYKEDYRNKKVYCASGSKKDAGGTFDWVVEKSYTVIPVDERFIFGNHEETAEFMVESYIPLTHEESTAILHHHGGMSYESTHADLSPIYNKYSLACLLHIADMLATYIDERY